MHEALAAALDVVLRDVDEPTRRLFTLEDKDWLVDDPRAFGCFLRAVDGSATGVCVSLDDQPGARVSDLADRVQDFMVEALWSCGLDATWPHCPRHPRGHPLAARSFAGEPVWVCPSTSTVIGRIGELSGSTA